MHLDTNAFSDRPHRMQHELRRRQGDGYGCDEFNLHHSYWEAKDSSDKLDVAFEG